MPDSEGLRLDSDEALRVAANALHEGPAQHLATALWLLGLCHRDGSRPIDRVALEQALTVTHSALKSVRETIHLLTSLKARHADLATLLRGMIEELREISPVKVDLRICDARQIAGLPFAVAWRLGAVARESVTNALKHANARSVAIIVGVRDGKATLQVIDDGKGWRSRAKSGMGLQLMQRHINSLGGTLEIIKRHGRGTCVKAVVPAHPTAAAGDRVAARGPRRVTVSSDRRAAAVGRPARSGLAGALASTRDGGD